MHLIDILVFVIYFALMLGVGIYFFRKNKNIEDYYIGGRSLGSWHIGLSVVATDVGGGFSIGLGGLGFTIGLAGSWMLFTGLIGAWLSAVVLIPIVSKLSTKHKFFTFPQIFEHFYNGKVALIAGIISAIGYIGFTSSQLLAGAKLASATFVEIDFLTALIVMGIIAVVYTGIGGMKAVIYTDTIQWIILMSGLVFIGIPISYYAIGGIDTIKATLGPEFLSMGNVHWQQLVNWGITIIPIWFVGMTLYQRIYASKSEKQAKKADQDIADNKTSPLTGVPIALKDLLCTKGIRTTCASKMLDNFIPQYDGTVVSKLKENGAIIIGKTNMDEFAMGSSTENSAYKITKNPWNKQYVPGGSSGGSAAAVAAGFCCAALGTDTGGSIRQPASHCGVVGLKPSYGRVSRFGLVSYGSSLDQIGPITKNVKDAAILLNIISGNDKMDSTSATVDVPDFTLAFDQFEKKSLKGMTAGIPKEYLSVDGIDPEQEKFLKIWVFK